LYGRLDIVEKTKSFLPLPGIELRLLGRPSRKTVKVKLPLDSDTTSKYVWGSGGIAPFLIWALDEVSGQLHTQWVKNVVHLEG
jgi:hypothetical protein